MVVSKKVKMYQSIAKVNKEIAEKIFDETTAYHWVVVILYYSLYTYLECLCQYKKDNNKDLDFPHSHEEGISIVKKCLKTASYYETIYNGAYKFRYDPFLISRIQDVEWKPEIKKYFFYYKKCADEIHEKMKNCV